MRLWDVPKGTCKIIKQHTQEVTAAVWLPDGDKIITGSHDKNMVRPLTPGPSLIAVNLDAKRACRSHLSTLHFSAHTGCLIRNLRLLRPA